MKPVVPFWVAILATVTGLLIVTGGFLIFYDLHWGQRSIELLKAYYLDQVADTAEKEVARLARIGVQALLAQRYRFETGSYTTDDSIALARTLAAVLPADPDIDAITFREGATGRVMSATRVDGKEFVLTVSDPRIDGGIPKQFRADTLAPLLHAAPPAGSPGRDGYRRAVAEPETIVWIPHDTSAGLALGITAALAVRDPSGRVIGVVTVNFARSGIAGFLRSIKIGEHGSVVLFGSNDESLAGAPGQGREAAALAVARWTRETGSPIVDEKARRTEILIDGAKWNIVARSIPREAGPPWIVAAALPDSDFMSPVYANRRAALAIMVIGTGLAVGAGVALSAAIACSLEGATRALHGIAKFELQQPPRRRSMLREVAQLEDAVARVTASLRSFTRYAPEEIVRDVAASGQEAILCGQKRDVTALFCDLRGFTAFTERLPAEDVVAILNDHFDLLVGIIAQHGGFVVDFLGDAVFAVFGALRPDADHAQRAVACAIEAQRARIARNHANRARGWPSMEMGAAISTGPAIVGNMGSLRRIKYGVVGSVVNVAARIETLTVGGQVLVADSTRQVLGEQLVVDGPLEAEEKGVDGVMRFWEVLALRGEQVRVLPSPLPDLAPLVTPIEARVRLILGKRIDRQSYPARVYRLGPNGAEFESLAPLEVFSALQLSLPGRTSNECAETVDAKVMAAEEGANARRTVVRFTGVDWSTAAGIET